MGHKVAVAEALQVAQEGGHPSVDDYLVQDNLLVQVGVVICGSRQREHVSPRVKHSYQTIGPCFG